MNLFISWSGERSRLVAELLKSWIQCCFQGINPWLSSKDIDKGTIWFSEITSQLSNTHNGILCLSKSNLNNPWILFEAGALAKGLSSNRVYTFLIDLQASDVKDPLAQFNHTTPDKESVYQLMVMFGMKVRHFYSSSKYKIYTYNYQKKHNKFYYCF